MTVWETAWAVALGLNLAIILCVVELMFLGALAGFLQAAQRGRQPLSRPASVTPMPKRTPPPPHVS